MEQVKLTGKGVGEKTFDLDHAQRIFDLQKKNPPATWSLSDPNYTVVKNKIEPVRPINPEED